MRSELNRIGRIGCYASGLDAVYTYLAKLPPLETSTSKMPYIHFTRSYLMDAEMFLHRSLAVIDAWGEDLPDEIREEVGKALAAADKLW